MIGGFGSLVPGLNLKAIGAQVIDATPALKSAVNVSTKVLPAVQELTDPQKGISSLKTTLVDSVKLAAADASATAVKDALNKAGVSPTNTAENLTNSISKAAENAQEKAEESAGENAGNEGENEGNGNEGNGNEGNGGENEGNGGENNANAGGGHKYEVVTLSSPIYDPLFVCYESGKPVYFTKNSKGINILKLHDNIEARYKPPPPAVKKKKALTKKKQKKGKKKATKSK